ncbi:MAG: LysE family transporter [Bilifractor sp.]|jgi:cysteine/O-acetylserine efflux protein
MSAAVLGALISYMLVSSFSPGPGNILTLNTMTRYGWKKGRRLFFGICCGYYCVQILCAFTIYCLSRWMMPALSVLRYIGAIYLIWLSVHIIRSSPDNRDEARKPSFWTGFLLQFVNVKIWFYGMTALSSYIVPWYIGLLPLLIAELVIASVGSAASLTWALLGVKIRNIYSSHYRTVNRILGAFLIYCALTMIVSKK